MTDPTGLHLGAGPYLLIYSHALPDGAEASLRLDWPHGLRVRHPRINLISYLTEMPLEQDEVEDDNRTLLRQLPEDIAKQAYRPGRPPLETEAMDEGP